MQSKDLNSERRKYDFTVFWFEKNVSNWERMLAHLAPRKLNVLEIGSFEGGSATWVLDGLFGHKESTLTVIDTFEGSIEHQTASHMSNANVKAGLDTLEARFLNNIELTGKREQVKIMKERSETALLKLREQNDSFDLLYIDGSHIASDVLTDAVLAWPLLKEGSICIFDDYKWDKYKEDYNIPRTAIDAFLRCYKPEIEILDIDYQVFIRKKLRQATYTPRHLK